jgi:hypothetical protein
MSVGLREIIFKYKERLSKAVEKGNNDEQFSCLMFALQLPSICARLDFPRDKYEAFYSDRKPRDRELYIKWLAKNHALLVEGSSGFLTFNDFCSAVYELRCSLVHEGILESNKRLQNIRFLSGNGAGLCLGDKQYIPLYYLCDALFTGALDSVSVKEFSTNQSGGFSLSYNSKVAVMDADSLVVDISELSDEAVNMRKRAEEFLGGKSKRESALFALYDYLAHWQLSVFDEMESHFAKDSIRRRDTLSLEIAYYGGLDGDSLEELGKMWVFRAKDGNLNVYRLSVDAGVYREMKKIVREFEQFIQRGKAL